MNEHLKHQGKVIEKLSLMLYDIHKILRWQTFFFRSIEKKKERKIKLSLSQKIDSKTPQIFIFSFFEINAKKRLFS